MNMNNVESINWLTIVDRLFLSQRYLPAVSFFQKLKAHMSWYWLIKKPMIEATNILNDMLKTVVYSSKEYDITDKLLAMMNKGEKD